MEDVIITGYEVNPNSKLVQMAKDAQQQRKEGKTVSLDGVKEYNVVMEGMKPTGEPAAEHDWTGGEQISTEQMKHVQNLVLFIVANNPDVDRLGWEEVWEMVQSHDKRLLDLVDGARKHCTIDGWADEVYGESFPALGINLSWARRADK